MLRRLMDRLRRRGPIAPADPAREEPAARDFVQEREDHRQTALGDEDRAWQEASLQRDRERRGRDQAPPPG